MYWKVVGSANLLFPRRNPWYGIVVSKADFASYIARKKNHYDVLGIPYDATDEEIKNAFVEKTQQLHPDGKNYNPELTLAEDKYAPDLTEQFMQIKTAYDTLRRSGRRKQYDRMMGIERLKRFNSRSKTNLYDVGAKPSSRSFAANFAMTVREFISRDFYVRLADSTDNSLMYFTAAGLVIILILQKLYVWYLQADLTEKPDERKKEEKATQ